MIIYQRGDWWRVLGHSPAPAVIRPQFKRVVLVNLYGSAIAIVSRYFHTLNIRIGREYFSILGILLSLLLVFRTNTAYQGYYEGRGAWGVLVSQCRGLAMGLNALLFREAKASRRYFAALISNLPITLEGSLRNKARFDKMEAAPDILESPQLAESVATTTIAVLMENVEQLRQV